MLTISILLIPVAILSIICIIFIICTQVKSYYNGWFYDLQEKIKSGIINSLDYKIEMEVRKQLDRRKECCNSSDKIT